MNNAAVLARAFITEAFDDWHCHRNIETKAEITMEGKWWWWASSPIYIVYWLIMAVTCVPTVHHKSSGFKQTNKQKNIKHSLLSARTMMDVGQVWVNVAPYRSALQPTNTHDEWQNIVLLIHCCSAVWLLLIMKYNWIMCIIYYMASVHMRACARESERKLATFYPMSKIQYYVHIHAFIIDEN